jgi:hypothetical protein
MQLAFRRVIWIRHFQNFCRHFKIRQHGFQHCNVASQTQGDQIWQKFAHLRIVYLCTLISFAIIEASQILGYFSTLKFMYLFWKKMIWPLFVRFSPKLIWSLCTKVTDSINENAWQDQVEDVEHGPAPELDEEGDVRKGVRAAAVVHVALLRAERLQLELPVFLLRNPYRLRCPCSVESFNFCSKIFKFFVRKFSIFVRKFSIFL